MKCLVATLALLACLPWNEGVYPPSLGPQSIQQILTCIGPPIRNQSRENIPVLALVPAGQGIIWSPTNGTVPLYHEPYETVFTDTDLRNRLIAHIGANYTTVTQNVTLLQEPIDVRPTTPTTTRATQFLQNHGCMERRIPDMYPNVTTTGILIDLDDIFCIPFHFWHIVRPYFFPNFILGVACDNRDNTGCSVPEGGSCIYDSRCDSLNVPMLQWDCCWTWKGTAYEYECGWRRVFVPLITGCRCVC